ncbi:MAG: NAD-dependent epimerase/dehydratase family protein [Sphingomonas sp.]|uniref:NAD-dependent epimerase/dehydratase family protein n=1 Tax=Sphingomonas sp. TaxID=28214 RepID=UPI0025ECBE1D|nr:NAD-dependent epimerase/dehydratase family protein [Sphingomonas sp.]MBX9881058.1 NAD-dependent epimerase/dehydratase family protein [Sphingomonas sp.]
MTLLVTGAAGFVGAAVCRLARQAGRDVREATRASVGEIGPDTDWGAALEGVDAVIHCAARAHVLADTADDPMAVFRSVNRDGTLALARAAVAAGVRRMVFVSSIGVNGARTQGRPFRADDEPAPHSPYAVAKFEAEQGLAKLDGIETVIVRPPLVIGPGAKGNIGLIAGLLRRGIPLPFGAITGNRRDLVSLEVLAKFLLLVADHPNAAGKTFLVSDGITRSTADLVRAVAAAEGHPARLLPIPAAALDLALRLTGRTAMREQLLGDLEVDIGATRSELDWTPQAR